MGARLLLLLALLPAVCGAEPAPGGREALLAALTAHLSQRGLAYTHRVPTLDARLNVPTCSEGYSISARDAAGLFVDAVCGASQWRRSFRFPPRGADWGRPERDRTAPRVGAHREETLAPRVGAHREETLAPPAVAPAAVAPATTATPAAASLTVWRTRVPIARGALLEPAQFEPVEVPANTQRYAISTLEPLAGRRAAEAIPRGTLLTLHMLAAPPAIERGQRVLIALRGAGFEINTEALAIDSAAVGESFRARNQASGEEFEARALASGRGVIDFILR